MFHFIYYEILEYPVTDGTIQNNCQAYIFLHKRTLYEYLMAGYISLSKVFKNYVVIIIVVKYAY